MNVYRQVPRAKNKRFGTSLPITNFADIRILFESVQTIFGNVLCVQTHQVQIGVKITQLFWKKRRIEVCNSQHQDHLKCIITRDENWIYAYDPETSKYFVKREARPRRPRPNQSKINVIFASLIIVVCGIINSLSWAKLSTKNIIWALCVVCVKLFV